MQGVSAEKKWTGRVQNKKGARAERREEKKQEVEEENEEEKEER